MMFRTHDGGAGPHDHGEVGRVALADDVERKAPRVERGRPTAAVAGVEADELAGAGVAAEHDPLGAPRRREHRAVVLRAVARGVAVGRAEAAVAEELLGVGRWIGRRRQLVKREDRSAVDALCRSIRGQNSDQGNPHG